MYCINFWSLLKSGTKCPNLKIYYVCIFVKATNTMLLGHWLFPFDRDLLFELSGIPNFLAKIRAFGATLLYTDIRKRLGSLHNSGWTSKWQRPGFLSSHQSLREPNSYLFFIIKFCGEKRLLFFNNTCSCSGP